MPLCSSLSFSFPPDHPQRSGAEPKRWSPVTSEWHGLGGRPRVKSGFRFLAGLLPTVTTACRGGGYRAGGKTKPLKQAASQRHTAKELRTS